MNLGKSWLLRIAFHSRRSSPQQRNLKLTTLCFRERVVQLPAPSRSSGKGVWVDIHVGEFIATVPSAQITAFYAAFEEGALVEGRRGC